jgi:hypothetical protein
LLAALKVLALSDVNVAGRPRLLTNRLKASRKSGTLNVQQSSKCTALTDEHVNRQM